MYHALVLIEFVPDYTHTTKTIVESLEGKPDILGEGRTCLLGCDPPIIAILGYKDREQLAKDTRRLETNCAGNYFLMDGTKTLCRWKYLG